MLVRNSGAQDSRFRSAFQLLENAVASRAFPACSLAITLEGSLIGHKALGRFTYDPASPAVTTDSIFDLASLTKPIATTTMAMILYERGLLDLEAPVAAIVPEFAGASRRRLEVTIRMLLAHSSGLPAYEKLFLRACSLRADWHSSQTSSCSGRRSINIRIGRSSSAAEPRAAGRAASWPSRCCSASG